MEDMTVKELIAELEKIEDKDAEVIISVGVQDVRWLKPTEANGRKFLIIGTNQ
jgi:hypothetical protein